MKGFVTTFFNCFAIDFCKADGVADVYKRIVGGWEFVAEFPTYRDALDFVNS